MADLRGTDRDLTAAPREHQWGKYAAVPVPSTTTGMRCLVCGAISDEESGHRPCPGIEIRYGPSGLGPRAVVVSDADEELLARIRMQIQAKQIMDGIDQEIANATPEQLRKFLEMAMITSGRVTVVLTRTELQKLFGRNIYIVRCEYQDEQEKLLITVEGEGLPRWTEGLLTWRVGGRLLDSAYLMDDLKGTW